MYQTIVFLPLLGAIVAGLISLIGARQRYPGGSPASGGENHADDHGPHLPAPTPHDASVIHPTGHEPGSGHGPAEPAVPAIGSPPAPAPPPTPLPPPSLLGFSALLSWISFVQVGFSHRDARVPLFAFINSGTLQVDWALRVDT